MDEKGLGKQLQSARQAAGFTQQQLCQKAGISFSTLTKIERGAIKSPSIFTVQAIASALHIGLEQLLGISSPTLPGRTLHKTKSGVSFVYFDVNGCLVHFFQRAFTYIAQETGTPSDLIETAYWHYNDAICRGAMDLAEFNAKMAERIGVNEVHWETAYLKTIEPIMQMQEVLKAASQQYKVGLLTNIMPGLLDAMRSNEQLPNIAYDALVDSSIVKAMKPEPSIFDIATVKAGVPASEILLIDDERMNITAAERAGWHVLWFDDSRPEECVERVRQALEL